MTTALRRTRLASALLVVAAAACHHAAPPVQPLAPAPAEAAPAALPFRNPDLPLEVRVADVVGRLTLDEKVGQLMNAAPAIERLGIPAYNWWSEGLHGVARAGIATVFPQAIGLAATWDTALMYRVATVVSTEARAKHHDFERQGRRGTYEGLTFWSPNINIFRDPRWGRGMETYGEDPYLTGRLAVAFVRGMQGDDPRYLRVVATPKHFAAHSGPEPGRHGFDAVVDARDLEATYLPAFRAAVTEGGAQSVMCAYNRLNGTPACANTFLLGQTLRARWGFGGYVVSDCDAVDDMRTGHKVSADSTVVAAMALGAGDDLNCGNAFRMLGEAVRRGLVTGAQVDTAVARLFRARFRLGMFDPPERVAYARIPISENDSPAHRALALETARKSIVLLRNAGGLLPLRRGLGRIAVIGPNADDVEVLLGNYNGTPASPVTPLAGIRAKAAGTEVGYAKGSPWALGTPDADSAAAWRDSAVALARRSDVTVLFLGLSPRLEGEELPVKVPGFDGGDRTSLDLPAPQEALLEAVVATGKPVVLVLINGSALSVDWAAEHVPAIVEAWYPGQAAGTAIADVLFGDYNPGGRLPVTFYRSVSQLPAFTDYRMAGRTYRFFRGDVLFPFGFGLSYTQFRYRDLRAPASVRAGDTATVSIELENAGTTAGEETVELYLTALDGDARSPIRSLEGFQRVSLAPGERRRVTLALGPRQLSTVDSAGTRAVRPGRYEISVGGRQPGASAVRDAAELEVLRAAIRVTGATVVLER